MIANFSIPENLHSAVDASIKLARISFIVSDKFANFTCFPSSQ